MGELFKRVVQYSLKVDDASAQSFIFFQIKQWGWE